MNDNTASATGSFTPVATALPITFDEVTPPVFAGFDGAEGSTIAAAPAGGSANALKILRNGGQPWAGATVTTSVPFTLTADKKKITARVYAPVAGIPFKMHLEVSEGGKQSAEVLSASAVVAGWQTLTWDFSNENTTDAWTRIVLLPNIETVGGGTANDTYYVDDINLSAGVVVAPPATTPVVFATFDEATPPLFAGFDGAEGTTIAASPAGGSANALKILRNGGRPWAGATVTTNGSFAYSGATKQVSARVYAPVAGIPFKMHLEVSEGGKQSAEVLSASAVVAGWQTLTWDFSNENTTDAWTRIVLLPNIETVGGGTANDTYYVDDITALGGVTRVAAAPPANPAAAMGSFGPVTIPLATAADSIGFFAAGNAIFASDYVGTAETGTANKAAFAGATTKGAASNGNIGFFNDPAMDSSVQKAEAGGWVSGSDSGPGIPNFFRYYVFTGTAAAFTNAYMGLYVNAPNNGTVDVSTFSNLKMKVWGPDPQYFNAPYLNPTLQLTLTGPAVTGCATGSGGTEITKDLIANQHLGAGSNYTIPLTGWTVKGVCGADTTGTAVASVLSRLARVVVTLPGSSFNFTNGSFGTGAFATTKYYSTGVNLGPIGFN